MKKDFFKRLIICLFIILFLFFISSYNVHAKSYSVTNQNTIANFAPSGSNINLNWSTLYYNSTPNIILSGWEFKMQLPVNATLDNILYNGRYLFSYYVFGIGTFRDLQCSEMTSNFKNINKTTGNLVQNEITSKCLDIYRTTYQGYNAYRFLYEFTYETRTGPDGIDEIDFIFNSGYNPIVGISTGMNYGFEIANISEYDMNIINTWNTDKQQQSIINQGQTQISQNEIIINQQNTNTNSIINNQNSNTQDIIDNQNLNTQQQIESQQVCSHSTIDKDSIVQSGYYLNSSGVSVVVPNNESFGVTDFYELDNNSSIKLIDRSSTAGGRRICFYSSNSSSSVLSCSEALSVSINNYISIPNNAKYVRFTIDYSTNLPQWDFYFCKNGNQALDDSINDLNDNINDDNVTGAESEVNDLLNNSAFQDNSGIQSIITAPLNFIQGLSNTCSPLSLTIPFINTPVSIPCMKQELTNRVPTVVPILSTVINGFIIYRILLDIVSIVKSAREPDEDRIEVLDL